MKVYIVLKSHADTGYYHIVGVYDTIEKAIHSKKVVKETNNYTSLYYDYDILEETLE